MTIEEIYQEFDMVPLEPNDPKLHKELFGDFLNEMTRAIRLQAKKNKKYLIPGHKGAEKSTFLNLLADQDAIKDEFLVVRYSINEIGNPYDFTHFDFLFSLSLKAAEAAIDDGVRIDKKTLEQIRHMVGIIQEHVQVESVKETGKSAKTGAEASFGLPEIPLIPNWLKARVYGALQLSTESRKKIREFYRVKPQELMSGVNDFLNDIATSAKKRLLFLVDDMDKIPLKESFDLFDANREFLEKPQANIVYTVNIALSSSSRYARIITIGDNRYFPSLKLMSNPKEKDTEDTKPKENRVKLKELIHRWCPDDFVDSEAREAIIDKSGGNAEETLRLLWYSLDHAVITSRVKKVTSLDVDLAVIRRRNEYQLNQRHIDLLKKVLDDPFWRPEENEDIEAERSPFLDLIYNKSLFEYIDGEDRWRYPNLILMPLLKK